MADVELSEEFQKYVDPEFWGGHMVSDGDAVSWKVEPNFGPSDKAANRYGRQTLKDRLATMQALTPLQKFETGMGFDASDHPTGTVILYKKHSLVLAGKPGKPVVGHDTEPTMGLNLGPDEGSPKVLREDRLTYAAETLWGIITQTRKGEPAILSYGQSSAMRVATFEVMLLAKEPKPLRTAFVIGETQHTGYENGAESLEKIAQLYICGYGKAKKVRRTAQQIVASLIPQPAINSPALGLNTQKK